MQSGTVRNRSGDRYKPSTGRRYQQSLRLHVLPDVVGFKLARLQRRDVQALADRLVARGHDPSTIRNAIIPLRVLCRRALRDGDLGFNPCAGVELPSVRGRRDRIATPVQVAALVDAVRPDDRALWGMAFYAGLRMGEIRALQWHDVDFNAGELHVRRALDAKGGVIAPKSAAGLRTVPMARALRTLLAAHRFRRVGEGYVFGSAPARPFNHSAVLARARRRWREQAETAALAGFGLHEASHTYASLMIATGVNAKSLSEYMGIRLS